MRHPVFSDWDYATNTFTILNIENVDMSYLSVDGYGNLRVEGRIDRDQLCPRQELCQIRIRIGVRMAGKFEVFQGNNQ